MTLEPDLAYHLRELEIARHPESSKHSMPDFSANEKAILDIGCGIGQTLASLEHHDRLFVGLDISIECLAYGRNHFGNIVFAHGSAERLPFRDGVFDLVISRVSLPYTNIPQSLVEVRRVLRNGGRVWFTLHSVSMAWKHLTSALRQRDIKNVIYRGYVISNGIAFHLLGKQFPFFKGKYESFQSISAMSKAMNKRGFVDTWVGKKGPHLVCTARKRA